MPSFKFDKKGLAALETDLTQKLKRAEVEANKAANRESTPANKARVFARVLRRHGVGNVDEAELWRRFGG